MSTYQHPVYTIRYACGCVQEKQILEATENKRRKVLKVMQSMKCITCLQKGSN